MQNRSEGTPKARTRPSYKSHVKLVSPASGRTTLSAAQAIEF